eukprot:3658203-Prymnesium_polylepis.1
MLFRKMSINQLGGIKELDFSAAGMQPLSVEDGRRLGGCLSLRSNLKSLDLQSVGMRDEAYEAIWANFASGAQVGPRVTYRPPETPTADSTRNARGGAGARWGWGWGTSHHDTTGCGGRVPVGPARHRHGIPT